MKAGDQEEPGGEDPLYHDKRTLRVIMNWSRISNKERKKMALSCVRSIAMYPVESLAKLLDSGTTISISLFY